MKRWWELFRRVDGGYVVSGWTRSLEGYAGFSSHMFLIKVDGNGNVQWNTTCPGLGENSVLFSVETDDGYTLAGTTRSTEEEADYDIWFA